MLVFEPVYRRSHSHNYKRYQREIEAAYENGVKAVAEPDDIVAISQSMRQPAVLRNQWFRLTQMVQDGSKSTR